MSSKTPERLSVVGIGASAGGLAALRIFLDNVPADSGLAFVVVIHLSPDHESLLAELLQPNVRIPVLQVTETTPLEPNRVYIIPPNANLSAIDTHLRLTPLESRRNDRAPIDYFLRTLAVTHDGNAIGVILTGTGADGTLGVKEIKAKGGLVIVQEPSEAEFDGMPQSAIATGLADFILPISEMPATILRYTRTKPRLGIHDLEVEANVNERVLLQRIFAQLRARTDRDFTRYKQSTVLRRIARRMQLNYVEELSRYLELLRERPEEVRALADDLLITVTHFFRDSDVFDRLAQEEIPNLLARMRPRETIRAWSVGCATGEEAYSLAMLLVEETSRRDNPIQIQVFASDLHAHSLEKARDGFYSGDIETDVSAERLRRFFRKEGGGYRIKKEIRDLVVFAPHNILSDPPFSRVDLISCRNLLIYLDREVQHDVIELFHYSLNPEGLLLLGSAESMDSQDLFRVSDKRLCFFHKRNVVTRELRLPVFPLSRNRSFTQSLKKEDPPSESAAYASLHLKMVEQFALPSVLVSPGNKLVHVSQRAGRYLTHPDGEPTQNILKLVREELRIELQASLQMVREAKESFDSKPVQVAFDGQLKSVYLHLRPAWEPERDGYVLVVFDEREPVSPSETDDNSPRAEDDTRRLRELESELNLARMRLEAIVESYETSQEEMRASSEEMQSTNEELRSTLEELETSKEEMQSINEELQTVNQQNRLKVEELAQLSSDLQNLLAATDIATLFLDRELRILRFTPKLGELINVRVTDRGRPISDLTHKLGYTELRNDAAQVLKELIPIEREASDESGRWYFTRVIPYRSTDDRIEGIVITFIDVDKRRRAEDALRASEERLRHMINVEVVGVLIFNDEGNLLDSNDTFLQMSGYSREEVLSRKLSWRNFTPPEYMEISQQQMERMRETGRLGPYEKEFFHKSGARSWMIFAGASLGDGTVVEYCIDVSDRVRAQQEVRTARVYAESVIQTLHEPFVVLDADLNVRSANPAFFDHFHVSSQSFLGAKMFSLGHGEWDHPAFHELLEEMLPNKRRLDDFELEITLPAAGRRVLLINLRRLENPDLILLGLRDITDRKRAEEGLRTAEYKLRRANESLLRVNTDLKHFSYAVSHDMQEPLRMVISYTQLLSRQLATTLDEKGAQYIKFATEGAQRMEMLLADLRDYWSVDDQKIEKLVEVDCNVALDHAIGYLKSLISTTGAIIHRGALPVVRGEQYPLTLLFQNLLSNAIKYRWPDTIPVIQVTSSMSEKGWIFSISDNGIGIAEIDHHSIFAPFKRLNGKNYPGSGLGLALCQKITERYNGRIWVESAAGKGATFKFILSDKDREHEPGKDHLD